MEKAITNFRNDVKILRRQIEDYLISLLKKLNVTSIDCYSIDCYSGDTPTIIDCTSDTDAYTLDAITMYERSNGENFIKFDCSNSDTNDDVHILHIPIELLVNVYEWVKANEEELFEDVE